MVFAGLICDDLRYVCGDGGSAARRKNNVREWERELGSDWVDVRDIFFIGPKEREKYLIGLEELGTTIIAS